MSGYRTKDDVENTYFGGAWTSEDEATRRRFLIGLAALPIVSATPFSLALAQAGSPLDAVLKAREAGMGWRSGVIKAKEPLTPSQLLEIVAADANQRRNLAMSLSDASAEALNRSFLLETKPAAKIIARQDISLVPSPQLIYPETPRVLPPEDKTEKDPAWLVVVDIIFETLDIGLNRALVQKAIESDAEVGKLFQDLSSAITTKDWKTVAGVVDKILEALFFGDLLTRILKNAGEILGEKTARRLARRSAFKLSLRFVPFVGWIYLGGSLVLAIKHNIHRFA